MAAYLAVLVQVQSGAPRVIIDERGSVAQLVRARAF